MGAVVKADFALADIGLIGGNKAILLDSITGGDIHAVVRQIIMWNVPDDTHSRTYSYVAVHETLKCGLPQWSEELGEAQYEYEYENLFIQGLFKITNISKVTVAV